MDDSLVRIYLNDAIGNINGVIDELNARGLHEASAILSDFVRDCETRVLPLVE